VKNKKTFSLFSVFFTFFVDSLAWAIVFPIFAPYFLNANTPLFAMDTSDSTRTTVLGLFLMAFSLGQFIGAPIIGELADRHGRKRTLLLSILCTFLGLIWTAWSMQAFSLISLFFSRFMTGVFASNGSVCLAAISDVSPSSQEKAKNFGYISVLAGLSFIVGACLGGKLSDPTLNHAFFPALPIWIAAALSFLNFCCTFLLFQETAHIDRSKPFSFLLCVQNIRIVLQEKKLHNLYLIYFLFIFAWTILLQFIPVILVQRFSFTGSNLGDLAFFVGISWAFGSAHVKEWWIRWARPSSILTLALLVSGTLACYVTFLEHVYTLMAALGLCVIFGGVVWPICSSLISDIAPKKMQGNILSIGQSIQALATTISPVVGGASFQGSPHLPFLIAGGAIALASLLSKSATHQKV
jgi:DHA1 family tetracycline resistance protein-like MFS transporter